MSRFHRTAALIALCTVSTALLAPAARAAAPRVVMIAEDAGHGQTAAGAAAIEAMTAVAGTQGIVLDVVPAAEAGVDIVRGADAIVLAAVDGEVLPPDVEEALIDRVDAGGGLLVIGSAVDAQPGSTAFGELVGARSRADAEPALAQVQVVDGVHPASRDLPRRWQVRDHLVPLDVNPGGDAHVLAWVDEGSYGPADELAMGLEHPVVWCRQRGGGRALTSALGRAAELYDDPTFRHHLAGALAYVAGLQGGDCGATVWGNWRKTTVDDQLTDATDLEVAPDGRVYYTEHVGSALRVYDPATDLVRVAGLIPSVLGIEGGLLGLALDPAFLENGWIYTFRHVGPFDVRVSRFTLLQDGTLLDPTSEVVILPITMRFVGHQGGGLEFGPDGNLYIAVGDNTNGGCCGGYPPIDEQPHEDGRFAGYDTDAQHSAANTNSLLGKVLRITPLPEGGYAIPDGNLFPPGTPGTRPEIYTMGHRNVFHIKIDDQTGDLLWGDVGNDAVVDDPARGPRGHDEFNRTAEPGNFGWPYCIADNQPYVDHDFATGTSRGSFDCAAPINDSPRNTGLRELPPSRPALIWYPYDEGTDFPELHEGSGARVAIPGPVVRLDDPSQGSMPRFFDGTWFIADLARHWIKTVVFDEDGGVLRIQRFAPDLAPLGPIDLDVAPDGSLYVLEFGARTQLAGDPLTAQLSRYEYVGPSEDGVAGGQQPAGRGSSLPAPVTAWAAVAVLAVAWGRGRHRERA
jgi:cytochrome c